MGSTAAPFDFSLTDLEVSFKITQILRLISLTGENVSKILGLNTNSESNTGRRTPPLDLTGLERHCKVKFKVLIIKPSSNQMG